MCTLNGRRISPAQVDVKALVDLQTRLVMEQEVI